MQQERNRLEVKRRRLEEARLPSWLKYALMEASTGRRTYADVGFHLGKHCQAFGIDAQEILDVEDDGLDQPSAILRRLFASEDHPKADLVDYIPRRRRRDVLKGMLCEVGGYGWEEVA